MLRLTLFILVFGAVVLLSKSLIPWILGKAHRAQDRKVDATEKKLDILFIRVNKEKIFSIYTLTPFILGLCGFLFFNNLLATFFGVGLGLILPTVFIKNLEVQRRIRFQAQLVDGLMILSSSLKGGLSLIQAIEVLAEEMPAPISQEFGLILRENKMGISLDESLKRLYQRMNMEELEMVINSILVARETGGNLTRIFSRLSTTIRDNRKLKDSIRTLTLQGRLQGIIMSILPFVFISMIVSFNPHHFDAMLQSELGRMLLVVAVVLQVVGMLLIRVFSRVRI